MTGVETDPWGIDDGYWSVDGVWHPTDPNVRVRLRVAMGGLPDLDDPPPQGRPVWFVREGSAPAMYRPADIVLEDGTALSVPAALPPDLPLGYHDLHPDDGGPVTRLIVVPARCHPVGSRRRWGWLAQLYAVHSQHSWGIGDLGDLRTLLEWAGGHGASVVGINPLHAPMPTVHQEASPYFPSSRRFRSPLYLRVKDVPGWSDHDPVLAAANAGGRELTSTDVIDRDAVHATKLAALEHLWTSTCERGDDTHFGRWRTAQGEALETFARFTAIAEHLGTGWRSWPAELRRPESPGVARFAAAHRERVDFHCWVQWLLEQQLGTAVADDGCGAAGLFGDLAVGFNPDGADAWAWQDVLALGATVGAPPDQFNRDGQDWGLPPFVPWKLRAAGYEPFAATVRAAMRYCSLIRIDHVMGLFRLYWVPDGSTPDAGGYVRYAANELLDIVALESVRSRTAVAGEDLGTVEDAVREALGAAGVLSTRVGWFEPRPPPEWPEQAIASLTTHDLPTAAGLWTDADGEEAMRDRLLALLQFAGLDVAGEPTTGEVITAAYQALAAAPCRLVAATLEDALGFVERPNVPGAGTDRPNWSIRLPVALEDLDDQPLAASITAAFGSDSDPD